jgi:hypothetical protein
MHCEVRGETTEEEALVAISSSYSVSLRKDWEEALNISGQTGHLSKVEEGISRKISGALCCWTKSQVDIQSPLRNSHS